MKKSKIATAAAAVAAINTGIAIGREAQRVFDERTQYTARINESSFVYPYLMSWLNEQIVSKSIKIVSHRKNGLGRYYDSTSKTNIVINGHKMSVHIEKPDLSSPSSLTAAVGTHENILSNNLVFVARSKHAIDALYNFLTELSEVAKSEEKVNYLYSIDTYGGWTSKPLPKRDLDGVFLPDGVKENIVNDLQTFIDNRDKYDIIGIPHHRGYLLYGPPGNGKSSLAAAMANHLGFHLYNMPLSTVKDDKMLVDLVNYVEENSILLLEDVDIFSNSVTREGNKDGPTLAGLLNVLDGVATPNGLITMVTTNYKEKLDDAFIRPGRLDYHLELSRPDSNQIERMFKHVYNESLGIQPREFESMAKVADVFKRNLTNPHRARLEIASG